MKFDTETFDNKEFENETFFELWDFIMRHVVRDNQFQKVFSKRDIWCIMKHLIMGLMKMRQSKRMGLDK